MKPIFRPIRYLTTSSIKSVLVVLCLFSLQVVAQSNPRKFGDEQYEPKLGQSGKDVIWHPTGSDLVTQMLNVAKVKATDIVYDLGAGDGKIAISAAKDFGAKAVGIEFNADMAALAQRNADRAGVSDRVKIINGDIFKEDFTSATVLTLYLLPELNLQLRPQILNMKPGTRVVSNSFHMEDWEPDLEIGNPVRAYYWVVPAKVAGTWTIHGLHPTEKASLDIVQYQQRVGGTLSIDQQLYPILRPILVGEKLKFSFMAQDQVLHDLEINITGDTAAGTDRFEYQLIKLIGKREKSR